MKIESGAAKGKIQEIDYRNSEFSARWRDACPLLQNKDFFEKVWRAYRANRNVYRVGQ